MENTAVRENPIKTYFKGGAVQEKFKEILGSKSTGFITNVLQLVLSDDKLSGCDPQSVYGAAATAALLDLPINKNLGFACIVAYNEKQEDGTKKPVAQFQMMYKGFVQLSLRSGQFNRIGVAAIYKSQVVSENPLTGYVFDFTKPKDTLVGYASYFRLINGFESMFYMTLEELNAHAKKYSKTYSYSTSKWKTEFESMAQKTVLKLNLSKYAPLSIEMQNAITYDQAKILEPGSQDVKYPDNTEDAEHEVVIDREAERIKLMIENAKDLNQLKGLEKDAENHNLMALFNSKYDELGGN